MLEEIWSVYGGVCHVKVTLATSTSEETEVYLQISVSSSWAWMVGRCDGHLDVSLEIIAGEPFKAHRPLTEFELQERCLAIIFHLSQLDLCDLCCMYACMFVHTYKSLHGREP